MSASAVLESINYGDTTELIVDGFATINVYPITSVISTVQNGNQYIITVKPILSTLYIITGVDSLGNQLEASATVYVNVTVINSIVNTNYDIPITLNAYGSLSYTWYPIEYLNITTGSTVISTPLKDITYTIQGTDPFGIVSITYLTITVNTFMVFTPSEPTVYDGNLLKISVEYINPYIFLSSNNINYTWTSNLMTGLPKNCTTSKYGSEITLHPYNSVYYTVNAYNSFNGFLLSSAVIYIKVIPKPSNLIDIDIIPTKLKKAVFNRNQKELIQLVSYYKVLSKKIIDFYYTTLQTAYRYEFTDKNGIPFKIKWMTIYQEKNDANEMILSFEQQWKFFQYINQYENGNFKYLLNTINQVYLEKPQKIRIMPLGTTTNG